MSGTDNRKRAGYPILLAAVAIAVIAGTAGVYEMTRAGNADAASCAGASAHAQRLEPLATGEVAALMVPDEPMRLPDIAFADAGGGEHTLSDWRDRVVLLNLWATWCAPCRHEMPALDNLQAELGSEEFEVVAVNIDTGDPDKPKDFLDEIGVEHLTYYADPTTDVFRDLKAVGRAFGMPTTLIIDRQGCELGHLAGPAVWDSEDALALIREAIARKEAAD